MTPRQLTFELPARPALGREDFFVSPANATALAAIEGWRDWPGGKLVLTGPEGAGKTHLAHVWAGLAEGRLLTPEDVAARGPDSTATGPTVLEDAGRGAMPEEALFHLHNLMTERGHPLLITARRPVRDWALTLPDLTSRLSAITSVALAPPDDALLSAVLVKQFADRQISVPPALIPYLAARIERSFEAARRVVDRLDAVALAERRAVTQRLAARVLEEDATPRFPD